MTARRLLRKLAPARARSGATTLARRLAAEQCDDRASRAPRIERDTPPIYRRTSRATHRARRRARDGAMARVVGARGLRAPARRRAAARADPTSRSF